MNLLFHFFRKHKLISVFFLLIIIILIGILLVNDEPNRVYHPKELKRGWVSIDGRSENVYLSDSRFEFFNTWAKGSKTINALWYDAESNYLIVEIETDNYEYEYDKNDISDYEQYCNFSIDDWNNYKELVTDSPYWINDCLILTSKIKETTLLSKGYTLDANGSWIDSQGHTISEELDKDLGVSLKNSNETCIWDAQIDLKDYDVIDEYINYNVGYYFNKNIKDKYVCDADSIPLYSGNIDKDNTTNSETKKEDNNYNLIAIVLTVIGLVLGYLITKKIINWDKKIPIKNDEIEITKESENPQLIEDYELWISQVTDAIEEFKEMLKYKSGYFTFTKAKNWNDEYSKLQEKIDEKVFIEIEGYIENKDIIKTYSKYVHSIEDIRKKYNELVHSYNIWIESIFEAVKEFKKLLDYKNGYFSCYQATKWKDKYIAFDKEIKEKVFISITPNDNQKLAIKDFIDYLYELESIRYKYNKEFIDNELLEYLNYFNNIDGKSLDEQQRKAVVTNEDNNLVIAGAGTGKTTTIKAKVEYVIKKYNVNREEILLLSFTSESAIKLQASIKDSGVIASTFHKFCLDVLRSIDVKPTIFGNNNGEVFKIFIEKTFNELVNRNDEYLEKVIVYFTSLMKIDKSEFDFANRGDYIQYLKDYNYKSYKKIKLKNLDKITYRREIVNSVEECKIANFLLFNGIDYEYEEQYEYDTATQNHRQYKPDFKIKQNGITVYLEHQGINRDGNVPKFFASEDKNYSKVNNDYKEKIKWMKNEHKKNNTALIQTFSYEKDEGVLFENLINNLTKAGIVLYPKSSKEKWDIIRTGADDEVSGFTSLLSTFITLLKSNNYSIADVNELNSNEDNIFKVRNKAFIELIEPLYNKYEDHLKYKDEIDFSDMINKATNYIQENKFSKKIRYIIIDEFQDISKGRYQLLKAIKDQQPSCKLFCVGDDWQSIYRFTGSDITLINDFEKYFGVTVRSKIETTYRFNEPLIGLSSDFISKNPTQIKKDLVGVGNDKETSYEIIYSNNDDQDDTISLQLVLDRLVANEPEITSKKIYLLGRYNFDIKRIKNEDKIFKINLKENSISYLTKNPMEENVTIKIEFHTVHTAKGLEADIVIILNCNSGKYGFPSEIYDDPVLNILLSKPDLFENAEERRLFYVAMTRAKEKLFFIADNRYKSKFIKELENNIDNDDIKKCPNCKTADLIKKSGEKNGKPWTMWGCSNYLYGCDYVKFE